MSCKLKHPKNIRESLQELFVCDCCGHTEFAKATITKFHCLQRMRLSTKEERVTLTKERK